VDDKRWIKGDGSREMDQGRWIKGDGSREMDEQRQMTMNLLS